MKRTRYLGPTVLLLGIITFSGCWDRAEIDERAFVMGVAVDLSEAHETNGALPPDQEHFPFIKKEPGDTSLAHAEKEMSYLVSVELAALKALGSGGGSGDQAPGTMGAPSWVIGTTAPTIQAAATAINLRVYRPLFFGHQRVLIIGKEAAMNGVRPILDFFARETHTTRKIRVAVAQGRAKDVLDITPRLEALTSIYLFRLFQNAPTHSFAMDADLNKTMVSLHSSGDAIVGRVKPAKDGHETDIGGAAVIKDWCLVGWLEDIETQGYALAKGISQLGRVSIPVATRPSAAIEYIYHHCRTKIRVNTTGGRPSFHIEICLEGIITEETAAVDITAEFMRWAEEALAEEITRRVQLALDKLQRIYGVDALDLGRHLEIADCALWRQLESTWTDVYQSVPISVHATAKIRRTGSTK